MPEMVVVLEVLVAKEEEVFAGLIFRFLLLLLLEITLDWFNSAKDDSDNGIALTQCANGSSGCLLLQCEVTLEAWLLRYEQPSYEHL